MKFHSNIFGWEYVWRDFADSKGGEVVSDSSKENNPIISVHLPVEGTDSKLSITPFNFKGKSHTKGTTATIHYSPREHFSFAIRTEKGVDQIGKALGMQDIQLGDQDFDQKYLIQGSDVGKVRNIFADMRLRDLILENGLNELRLVDDAGELPAEHRIPKGRHAVLFTYDHVVDKFEHLEGIFNILTSVVHKLGAIPALAGEEEQAEEASEETQSSNRLHSPLLDMA